MKHDFLAPGPTVYAANVPMTELTSTGSVGDPSKATKQKGEKILAAVIERASEFIQDTMS